MTSRRLGTKITLVPSYAVDELNDSQPSGEELKRANPFLPNAARLIVSVAIALGAPFALILSAYAAPTEVVEQVIEKTKHARLLLVGEIHGTQESPELIIQIVDQWMHRNVGGEVRTPVIVGLEYPQTESRALAAYLGSDGGLLAMQRFMESLFWNRKAQDGRSSQSMFALIEAMRQRIQRGGDIRVVPFDMNASQIAAEEDRDLAMAENLRAAVEATPLASVVALMGNYHARKADGAPWNPSYRFMGAHLKDLSPFSLLVEARRGAYWICSGPKPADCKETSFKSKEGPVGVYVDNRVKAQGYDLALLLDRFSASPPVSTAKLLGQP